ncbi:MAG: hypothetical protein OXK76_05115 [Gammaproteobacteria bacterium]|nr:hypothetical protein [Gammaproteobacteria bacterium]
MDWDNEPGFDEVKERYVQLDLEAWLAKHAIREEGRRQGAANLPAPDVDGLDATEEKILAWVNLRARVCRRNVSDHLADLERELTDIESDQDLADLKLEVSEIGRDGELALGGQVERGGHLLLGAKEAVREDTADFRAFRRRARLTRQADYSHRRWSLPVILTCFVVEIVLNATLLMEVNAFGLVGSSIQMALISFVNIFAAGLAMGFLLRQRNHVGVTRRSLAWIGIVVLLGTTVAFNLAIGHFRDSMQAIINDPGADILALGTDVVDRFLANAAALDSFQSYLLALLGFLFFCIASWKWLQRDDPYPDYGRRHRQFQTLRDNYIERYDTAQRDLKNVHDQFASQLEDRREGLKIKQSAWKDICVRGQHLVDEYEVNLGQYPHDLNHLVAEYRAANRAARMEPVPRHFGTPVSLDAGVVDTPPAFSPPPPTKLNDMMEHVHGAVEVLRDEYGKAARKYPTLEELDGDGRDA